MDCKDLMIGDWVNVKGKPVKVTLDVLRTMLILFEDVSVDSFIQQDVYWNFGTFKQLAEEMKLVLDADYSYPVIIDENHELVDGAHRIVHAYLDGAKTIKGVVITNDQWPEADYDETKAVKQYQDGKVQEDIQRGLEKASH